MWLQAVLIPSSSWFRKYTKRCLACLIVACSLVSFQHFVAQTCSAKTPVETLDLNTIERIREEGLKDSHVMQYASELADGIGQRLTGSPGFEQGAQWCLKHLRSMGVSDARQESWGDFGMAWTQIGTVLQLQEPSPATLIAQAMPWSPATHGDVTAPVVLVPELTDESQLESWKGKLSGKVIMYGAPPPIDLNPKSPLVTIDDGYFKKRMDYPLDSPPAVQELDLQNVRKKKFVARVASFFADEGALAILRSTRGDANMFHGDDSVAMGWLVFLKEHRQLIPSAIVSSDGYGRLARLLVRNVPVTVKLNIGVKFGSDHAEGKNVLGDIEGTDPKLRDQVVMLGAHLDSWATATGATDDGAGIVIALETLRILKTLNVKPRRTIRIGLWGGEEEGMIGSLRYVEQHFASPRRPVTVPWTDIPEWARPVMGFVPKADYNNLDVYFNADAGGGRCFGIYCENNLGAAAVFRRWLEPLRDLGVDKVSLVPRQGVDSLRFDEVGLPGFQLMQDLRDYDSRSHHTNLDTYERLSEPDLKQAATIMAVFVFNAAQRDGMIPRKFIPGGV